jgi:hypothetical protein
LFHQRRILKLIEVMEAHIDGRKPRMAALLLSPFLVENVKNLPGWYPSRCGVEDRIPAGVLLE